MSLLRKSVDWIEDRAILVTMVLVALGFAARVVLSLYFSAEPVWHDTHYYLEHATGIVEGRGYDPKWERGPVFSYWMAALFAVFGKSLYVVRIANALLWLAIAWMTYRLCEAYFDRKLPAVLAASTTAIYPFFIYMSSVALSETVFIALALGAIFCLEKRELRWTALGGLLIGIACATRSTAFLIAPLFGLWLLWQYRSNRKTMLTTAGVFTLATAVFAGGYLVTLKTTLGVWTLSGYGKEFLHMSVVNPLYGPVGNLIHAHSDMTEEQRAKVNSYFPHEAVGKDFVTKERLFGAATRRYIQENPGEFLFKTVGKFINVFRLRLHTHHNQIQTNWVKDIAVGTVLGIPYLLFFVGLFKLRRRLISLGLPLAVLAASIIAFSIYHSRVRYTLSILPFMLFFAAYAATHLLVSFRLLSNNGSPDEEGAR